MMKSLNVTLILILPLFMFTTIIAASTTTTASSQLAEIVFNPKPHVINMSINNMPSIDDIFTTGHYAWAIQENPAKVAFYDGTHWSGAQSIPGITTHLRLYPAYPLTGAEPTAWAIGGDGKLGDYLVSYFNGSTWSKAQLANKILELKDADGTTPIIFLRASAGHAYLITSIYNGNSTRQNVIYSVNAGQGWTKPGIISNILFLPDPNNIDSMNDSDPNCYFIIHSWDDDNQFFLYRINTDGTATPIYLENAISLFPEVLIDNDYKYIFSWQYLTPFFAFNNNHMGNTWKYPAINYDYNETGVLWLYPSNEHAGLVCNQLTKGPLLYSRCINTNMKNPTWSSPILLTGGSQNYWWWQSTRADGMWLAYYFEKNNDFHVLDYNFKTNKFTDTHFLLPLKRISTSLHAIDPHQVMVCSSNSQMKPQLYYYDNQKVNLGWQKIDTSNIALKSCRFSVGGNSDHPINVLNPKTDETLWIFNNTKSNSGWKNVNYLRKIKEKLIARSETNKKDTKCT